MVAAANRRGGRKIAALMRERLAIEKDRLGRIEAKPPVDESEPSKAVGLVEAVLPVPRDLATPMPFPACSSGRPRPRTGQTPVLATQVAQPREGRSGAAKGSRPSRPRWTVNVTLADGSPWNSRPPRAPVPTQDQLLSGPHAGLDGEQLDEVRDKCGRWVCKCISMFAKAHKDRKAEAHAFACQHRVAIRDAFWVGRAAADVLAELGASWTGGHHD
jgi:hypothetical protein